MQPHESSRRFVIVLADWAAAARGDPHPKRALMDPLQEFWPWMRQLVRPYYRQSLNKPGGMTMVDFMEECKVRVMRWAKNNLHKLQQTDFTDVHLKWMIKAIARNTAVSMWRPTKGVRIDRLDSDFDEQQNQQDSPGGSRQITPEALRVDPEELENGSYPLLQEEFVKARQAMLSFFRSVRRKKKKMRQLLALLLYLGRRIGRVRQFPGYWFVFRILTFRGKHLPKYVRGFLQAHLPRVKYSTINSRLVYLRRAFENFCVQ